MNRFDVIVVGQGLAGTTLTWCLRWAGKRVCVIDDARPDSASRVAAGLITPVTGKRLATHPRFIPFRDVALDHYRRCATSLGSDEIVRDDSTCFRRFMTADERLKFDQSPTLAGRLAEPHEQPCSTAIDAPHGGFVMPLALRLDVPKYLCESRRVFSTSGETYLQVHCAGTDLVVTDNDVCIPELDVSAEWVVFCTGLGTPDDPWFGRLQFEPAKGEVLTLDVPGLQLSGTVHGGVWLTRLKDTRYLCGSTYDREDRTTTPTPAGREELERRLRGFLRLPYSVVEHRAGVRPITPTRGPVLGFHPANRRVAVFTGLSSKGALFAPYYAAQFTAALDDRGRIDADVDVGRLPEFAV